MKTKTQEIDSRPPRQADTRQRILDVAERLFMAQGYDVTSMRQITAEAGANLAAVNYHFGSKESLIHEVFKRRLDWLNGERLRVLDALEAAAASKPLKPSQIVDAFFGTLLRMATNKELGGDTFLRLLGRTMNGPAGFIGALFTEEYADVLDRYKTALYRALPDVPREEIVWRFHFMLGATSYAIAGTDALKLVTDWQTGDAGEASGLLQPRLMSFLLGGLRAPLPNFAPSLETMP